MKAYKIEIDNESNNQSSWVWHYGNLVHEGKEYPFTLLEMSDALTEFSSYELTWCDDEPKGLDLSEIQVDIVDELFKN